MAITLYGSKQNIIQVVQTFKTDTFSSVGSTPTSVTGLSVSITPSSSLNKILVVLNIGIDGYNQQNFVNIQRNGTNVGISTGGTTTNCSYSMWGLGTSSGNQTGSVTYLDSPATTSAVTYQVQIFNSTGGGTTYVNRSMSGGYGMVSSITVYEVAYA